MIKRHCTAQHLTGALRTVAVSPTWISAENPRGYGVMRRFDTAAGVIGFEEWIAPALHPGNIFIIWEPGGERPQDGDYPIDAADNLRSVFATMEPLIHKVRNVPMRFGVCLRPGQTLNPGDADPNNPEHVAFLIAQLDALAAMSVNAYYMDSVGYPNQPNGIEMVKIARRHNGPSVPYFTECTCPELLPYADVYCEIANTAGDTHWFSHDQMLDWKNDFPAATFLGVDKTGQLTAQEIRALGFVPLVEDTDAAMLA